MACSASTLISSASSAGFESLDERTIMLAIIGSLNSAAGNPTATQTMAAADAYGFDKTDDQSTLIAIASYLCSQSACDLQTTINSASTNGLTDLEARQVLIGILQVVSNGVALTTLLQTASSKGYQSLSENDLTVAIAQLTINNASNLQTLMNSGATTGFWKLSRAILMAVLLQLYCDVFSVTANFRITDDGSFRITLAGDNRIWV